MQDLTQDRVTALSTEFTRPMKGLALMLGALFLSAIWWLITPGPSAVWYVIYVVVSAALVYMGYEFVSAYGWPILRACGYILISPLFAGIIMTSALYKLLEGWGVVLSAAIIVSGLIALMASILQSPDPNGWHIVWVWIMACLVIGAFAMMMEIESNTRNRRF